MSPRQRRGVLILVLAVLAAVTTFVSVLGYTRGVEAQLGPRRPVVIVTRDVPAYQPILSSDLAVRQVPVVFSPDGALATTDLAVGKVSPLPLRPGTWLQAEQLAPPPALQPGERAVTLAADGEMSLAQSLRVGDFVDVVAAYRQADGQLDTALEVQAARVLGVRYPGDTDESWVTLAVTEEETRSLARVRAAASAVFVGRVPETEVP